MTAKGIQIRQMVLASLFASLMAVCAWISIPLPGVSFTLQLFAVFLALEVLGGKWGCAAILLYLAMGASGMPVFSGFRGGAAVLLGPSGGFLLGFLILGLTYRLCRETPIGLTAGLLVCYGFGCWWYRLFAAVSWQFALMTCVAPWIVPDLGKLALALLISRRLKPHIKR